MKLPNSENALVEKRKVTEYLLSRTHPHGQHKARFFEGYGFELREWTRLALALRQHAAGFPVVTIETTAFGMRYTIEGALGTPDGRRPTVRSVWFADSENAGPRLVTAYPIKKGGRHD